MKKADIILFCSIILCSLFAILLFAVSANEASDTAVVTVNGKEYARLSLDKDTQYLIETERGSNLLVVKDGEVYITEASCPDKVCIRSGKAKEYEPIVCLPNSVVVSIEEGCK